MTSTIHVSEGLLALTLVGDTGTVVGVFLWRQEAPELVPVACINGVLSREGLTVLRDYCNKVLRRMDGEGD